MTKVTRNRKTKTGNFYEQVSKNIQKITTPSGTTKYRVRFGTPDGEISQYATSLKKAYSVRKELMA